jgi:hypothetical protein
MYRLMNTKIVTTDFLVSICLCLSLSSVDLLAQQRGTISVIQATALPLVNSEGNQVKVVLNYSIENEALIGKRINSQMGIYDRVNGSLIKLTSFPDGFVLNSTKDTIQMASTLTDPKIQNISTIVTLTNEDKTEKYSNDVRSDLDLSAILPTFLSELTLDESLSPSPLLLSSSPAGIDEEDQDDSDSNSDEE